MMDEVYMIKIDEDHFLLGFASNIFHKFAIIILKSVTFERDLSIYEDFIILRRIFRRN